MVPRTGPRVPFAPALLTLSLHITLHIYFISSRLFILLYVTCVMVNKAVEKKRTLNYNSNNNNNLESLISFILKITAIWPAESKC